MNCIGSSGSSPSWFRFLVLCAPRFWTNPVTGALGAARAIRAEQSRVGLIQEQLGERVGLHRATIGAIETMTRHVYTHELADICEALDVTLDELLPRPPTPTDAISASTAEATMTRSRGSVRQDRPESPTSGSVRGRPANK